jgi:hypothetical protein
MTKTESTAPVDTSETQVPTPPARGLRTSTVFIFGFAVAGLDIGIHRLHDNSFMWHVRTGTYILDHGIPHHDPYSFSAPGAKWVAQSWLAELAYGMINHAWGGQGLRLFGAVVGALFGAALFYVTWKLANDRVRALGIAGAAFCVVLEVWSERPLMLGLAGMLAVVAICELPDSWIGRRPMVWLPIVMWLWANVHGTFALGFLYLALHLAGRLWEGAKLSTGPERGVFRGTAIAAVVVWLNPYGIDLVLFPLRLMGRSSVLNGVQEWQSPNFRELGGQIFAAWIVLSIIILARKQVGRRDLLVTIVFLMLGLYAIRNIGLAAVVVMPVLARAVRRDGERSPDPRSTLNTVLALLLVVVGAGGVLKAMNQDAWDLRAYPVKAYAAVQAQVPNRHLLTTDGWAGYVIAKQGPTIPQKVFYDDRYDMYPLDVGTSYDAMAGLQPNWLDELNKWKIDVVMWPARGPLVQGLTERPTEWTKIYSDKLSVVFVRKSPV